MTHIVLGQYHIRQLCIVIVSSS